MAVEVADLIAKLRADVADFMRKFEQAGQSIKKVETATGKAQATTKQFGTELSRLPGPLGQVASRASSFAGILTGPLGVVAGLTAVVGGLTALIRHTLQTGEELRRLSIITGQSVETLSALRLAAETNETSLQEVARAMGFLQRAMAEAGTGNEELLRLFTALGVAVRDLQGNFRPTEAVMEDVAKSMQRLSSNAERVRVVMALFGISGRELLPLLDDLAKRGFAGVREEAQRLNLVLSTEAANAADALGDKFTTLRLRLSALAVSIGNQLIPALNDLLTILQHPRWELFAAMGAALTGNWQGALTIFRELQKELRQMESLDVFRQQRAGERGLMPPTIRLPDEAALKALKAMQTLLEQMTLSPLAADAAAFEHQMNEFAKVSGPAGVALIQKLRSAFALITQMKIGQAFAQDWEQVKKELDESKARVAEIGIGFGLLEPTLEDLGNDLGLMGQGFEAMNPELAKANAWSARIVNAWVLAGRQLSLFPEGWRKTEAEMAAALRLAEEINDEWRREEIFVRPENLTPKPTEEAIQSWKTLFDSILLGIDRAVQGVIQGTQTMQQAFQNLAQSIALQFSSIALQQALTPAITTLSTSLAGLLGVASPWISAGLAAGGFLVTGLLGGFKKKIPSIEAEMQARLNEIFAPWFARFEDDMAGAGEEAGKALMTGVQKGAEAIGLGSFVRELGFERMHVKDFEEILKPILEATANLTSAGLQAGLRQGTQEEGFQAFQASIYQGVRTAIITALSQGAAFQAALAPLIAVLQTQTGEALMLGIASAVEFMVAQIAALEPIFNALFEAWQAIEAGIPDIEAPDISAPDTGGFEESAEDLANSIDQLIQDLHRTTAEIQGLDAEVANLAADLALTQSQMDRTRVEMETATDPSKVVDLARELMDLTVEYYETQKDLATALHEEILRLSAVMQSAIQGVTRLTLGFTGSATQSLELAYGLASMIDTFEDVATAAEVFIAVLDAVGQAFMQAAVSGTPEEIAASIDALLAAAGATSQVVGTIMSEITDPEVQLGLLMALGESLEQLYQDTLSGIRAAFDRMREMERDASQERIEALQAERDAIIETMDAQLDAARETLRVVQEWARVAETLRNYLLDLQLGTFAPPNPMAAFGVAQSEFDAAVAAFRAGGTPQTAQAVQEMAQRLLQEASEVFARPSPEYAALFTSITSILDEVNAIAQEQAATEEELLAEIKSLDEERNAQLESIEAAIKAEQEALEAKLDELNAAQAQTEADAQAFFASQFSYLQSAIVESMIELELKIEEQTAQLEAVIGEGNTYEAFIAEMTQQEVAVLQQIDADLKALLSALGISYAEGTEYVPKTGPYLLHQGEQVIPPGVSTGGVYIAPGAIVVSGVSDPDRAAELMMEKLYRSLKSGKARKLVEAIK